LVIPVKLFVVKLDGRRERFDLGKLRDSVLKALDLAGLASEADSVIESILAKLSGRREVTARDLADVVESEFVARIITDTRYEKAARYYVLGRIYNHVYGKGGWGDFHPEDLGFTYSALRVLYQRYLLKDPRNGRVIETPKMLFMRVAENIAKGEDPSVKNYWAEKFYELMITRRFIPNSPTLMNAGTKLGILSACFVIPVRDAMVTEEGDGIYDAVRAQAIVFQQGGGCGFNFSELRPESDIVASTSGVASGPLSFMKIFDVNTDVIKQGGRRRGANMGVLHVWHADIRKFIKAKTGDFKDRLLQNFNISVGMYDYFIEALKEGKEIPLINPRKTSVNNEHNSRYYAAVWARHSIKEEWVQEVIINELEKNGGSIPLEKTLLITWDEALTIAEKEGAIQEWADPIELFDEITKSAWEGGDPGLLFIDTINRRHPTWYLGKINATNPCGEEPLLEWESCNLGSINLEKYVVEVNGVPRIDWEGLARDVRVAVRFLDDVISVSKYPIGKLAEAARRARKVGLGVMGWAHMLIRLGIPYDSSDAVYLGYVLSEWIAYNAYLESIELAREKGSFPAWDPELYRPHWWSVMEFDKLMSVSRSGAPSEGVRRLVEDRPPVDWRAVEEGMSRYGLRNAALLSVAPTGTISIIAGTSSSIEPVFALAFTRVVTVGTFVEVNPLFLEALSRYGLDEPEVVQLVAESGTVARNPFIPRPIREVFRTAHDVEPKWHVLHQSAWQQWVDAGVSKTVNLRHDATVDDVWNVYLLAWALGCKGITVYRDKSKSQQVINFGVKLAEKLSESGRLEEEEAVQGAETITPAPEIQGVGEEAGIPRENNVGRAFESSAGSRFRITGIVLEDGDVGDCKTCDY